MKLDRRCFLSLGIGAAAGTVLSPLPWKLMDDVSIWSQNWPWTPVPEDGEVTFENSTCSLCPGGCGITVRRVNGRPIKIEGMAQHPINNGGICILGLSGLQLLFTPTRVQSPMKRVGKRGEGKWRSLSWPEAINEVTGRLKELRGKGEAHTVVGVMDRDQGTVPRLLERLLTAYGTPNFFRIPSVKDSYELALHMMHGTQSMAAFDVDRADCILSFGAGLIEGWGSPVHVFQANSSWKEKGVKVIQVEPRLSNTAAKADTWLPILPGTEAALALGIAHVMIKENRVSDFVSRFGQGYDDWTDEGGTPRKGFKTLVLENYDPQAVSALTGIEASAIEAAARTFMAAKRPLALCGRGKGRTPLSTTDVMAVHALNALAGNLNQPGGAWAVPEPDYIQWPDPEMDQTAAEGIQKGRVDGAGGAAKPQSRYLLNRLAAAINTASPYPVNALLVAESNPCYSLHDAAAVREALAKVPFVVSFSSYWDETAENADLILPNHHYLERFEEIPAPAGFCQPLIGLARPVVPPQLNTRHLGDVILAISRGLGESVSAAFPWKDYRSCLKATLGDKWAGMEKNGFWTQADYSPPAWDAAFETASKKFAFGATVGDGNGKADGPVMPAYEPVKPEGDPSFFPLVLIPFDTMRLSPGYIGSPPFLIKTVPDTVLKGPDGFVEINPETARKYELCDKAMAVLQTPKAKLKVRVHCYEGIRPGVVAMAAGLGHTAYDEYLNHKGVNVNELMGSTEDPVSGLDAAWGIRAKLVKA
jgi:anaerobic selenocysteine-containing dehydrogenase